jgi:enoyl-CoA hydratase/carnithine racemase
MKLVELSELPGDILQITLNNPDHLNALTEQLAHDFLETVKGITLSKCAARALIIRGQGKAFSAGGDLKMLLGKIDLSPEENQQRMLQFYKSFLCVLELEFPVIAAINGTAVGAGLALACACDLRIASSTAKLGFGFIKLGLHPGLGSTFFVPRLIGHARSAELFLSNKIFDADYAAQIGLVNRVCSADSFESELQTFISDIAGSAPFASSQLVQTLRPLRKDYWPHLEREAYCQMMNYQHPEFKEGVTAMLEKRAADFKLR